MGRPRWVALVAVLGAFMLVSAGCASDEGGGGAQSEDCSADQFGCLTLASGEPIYVDFDDRGARDAAVDHR